MAEQDEIEARLQSLHDTRGPNLVAALIRELGFLHRQVLQLQAEMAAYREYMATRDRWLSVDPAHRTPTQLPKSVAIDASQSLHARNGFYGLEYGDRGVPFCWTGPSEKFSFDIFIDRSQGADLELRALGCLDYERQRNIKLAVNGEPVAATVTPAGRGFVIKAELPATGDDASTNLVFTVPEVLQPADSPDKRHLGIAFTALSVNAPAASAARARPSVVSLSRGASKRHDDEAAADSAIVAADKAAS